MNTTINKIGLYTFSYVMLEKMEIFIFPTKCWQNSKLFFNNSHLKTLKCLLISEMYSLLISFCTSLTNVLKVN